MENVKARQMISKSGNPIPNQFVITVKGNIYFQSYNSIIVKMGNDRQTYLDERYWDYSVTTGKYRNMFLGETKKETEKNIADGTYKLTNLN